MKEMFMFNLIREDINIHTNCGTLNKKLKYCCNYTFHLLLIYRLGCWCYQSNNFLGKVIAFILEYFVKFYFSSDISCKSQIGPGLNFMHGSDIVIGSEVVAGKCLKIFNGVTLGNKDTETTVMQQPKIGDFVIIGSGAKVLGGVEIGNNVKIGANAVVTQNVPDDSSAVGVPAKILRKPLK